MAASKKSIRIGVIAEEHNDVEVLYEYTSKLIATNRFAFSRFVGHGCGAIKKKCRVWAENLVRRGCVGIVVIHDRDDRSDQDAIELKQDLEKELAGLKASCWVVLIPVEEIEAWLLADPAAISKVFNFRKAPKIPKFPETINSPKEYLEKLVAKNSKSSYINTIHNRRIAAEQGIGTLDRCPSFAPYPKFVSDVSKS